MAPPFVNYTIKYKNIIYSVEKKVVMLYSVNIDGDLVAYLKFESVLGDTERIKI